MYLALLVLVTLAFSLTGQPVRYLLICQHVACGLFLAARTKPIRFVILGGSHCRVRNSF
jgi:hypothetical protein